MPGLSVIVASGDSSLLVVPGLLTAEASFVAEHGLQQLQLAGSRAWLST